MITHQTQPSDDTCASACIAMILGIPVEEVIEEFHEDFFNRDINVSEYLTMKGVRNKQLLALNDDIYTGRIYLLTVPSLNFPGLMHYMLMEVHENYYTLHDPNWGREGKKHYIPSEWELVKRDECRLRSFITELEVVL